MAAAQILQGYRGGSDGSDGGSDGGSDDGSDDDDIVVVGIFARADNPVFWDSAAVQGAACQAMW